MNTSYLDFKRKEKGQPLALISNTSDILALITVNKAEILYSLLMV